jgi:hypothetical protein
MTTPLSIDPYKSRFSLDPNLLIGNNSYDYVNMIYHGFYGGTSLQSQELNELQENIQNQLSIANTLIGNWLEYDNNINIHGEPDGGIYNIDGLSTDVFIPIDPENIIDPLPLIGLNGGWYLYKDNHGYEQFIVLLDSNIPHKEYYENIESRIVSGVQQEWDILRDNSSTVIFDRFGANRIQLFPADVVISPVEFAYVAALNTLESDCSEIIARFNTPTTQRSQESQELYDVNEVQENIQNQSLITLTLISNINNI